MTLIEDFDTAMLVTRRRAGALHARPMSIAATDADGTIWFVTGSASVKVDEVSDDSRVTVTFQRPNQFVSLNGQAALVFDQERIRDLWKEGYRMWCERNGHLAAALLRFTPSDAEYWDVAGVNSTRLTFERPGAAR